MLCMKVQKLELTAAQRTYELNVDLKLGAVSFDQYRMKNEKEQMLQVINTPRYHSGEDYLFTLSYTNVRIEMNFLFQRFFSNQFRIDSAKKHRPSSTQNITRWSK